MSKRKKNPKVEIKERESSSGTVKGTGPIFEYSDEDFKQWCTNTFLKNKGDTSEIDAEFTKMKNLTDEDMDKLLDRQSMYNESIDNLMIYLANEEKSKHPEIFVDPKKIGAVLEDIEVPYGKKIVEMDNDMLEEFLSYAIVTGRNMEIEDCLYRDDKDYDNPRSETKAHKVYARYMNKYEQYEFMSESDKELWKAEIIENHVRLFRDGTLNDLIEVDDGIYVPSSKDRELLKDWGFAEPDLTMPEDDTDKVKDLEPRDKTIEFTADAREEYLSQTVNEFATISADNLGVDGKSITDDYDHVLSAIERVQNDPNITPMSKERIGEMFRKMSNDDDTFTHLSDEQLKALFYVPKNARWYHRAVENSPYKRDILADGYTDENGLAERKDNESIMRSNLKKIRDENYTYIMNALTMAVDTLHPKLIEFSKTLSEEEMSMLSIIFKTANIEFKDLEINHTGFSPATSSLLIEELYEILESMDETLIPGVKTARDVVFYLDKHINSKEAHTNIIELVYKTLIDLAYVGFINPNMTEYIYTATALTMAIDHFIAHPLYKYYDHVSGQEVIVNMLDRINARKGDKVNPLGYNEIEFVGDQIVNEIGGSEMVRIEGSTINATAGLKQNVGLDPNTQSSPYLENNGSVWGDSGFANTTEYPGANKNGSIKPKVNVIHSDGTPATNLFPKKDNSYQKLLAGDRSGLPVIGMPQYNNSFSTTGLVGQPSSPPVAVYNDPMIDRDISIGSGHLAGLPNFNCTEEFYCINSQEIAIKYSDGRVYIVQGKMIPLIQEIYSMRRKEIEASIKAKGGFMQPSVYGTSDKVEYGVWSSFPPHIRYKVSSEHDNVWRVELVMNNNLNNNNLGGNEMVKNLNGMEGFGIGATGTGMTSAGMAMAGLPTAMSGMNMTQPMMNTGAAMQATNVYSTQLNNTQPMMNTGMSNGFDTNAVIANLQAQIAALQQQVQSLQMQLSAARNQAAAMPMNTGISMYSAMSQPNNAWNATANTYNAYNQGFGMASGPVQVSQPAYQQPMMTNTGYNAFNNYTANNTMMNNGMNNGFARPVYNPINTMQPVVAPVSNTTPMFDTLGRPVNNMNQFGGANVGLMQQPIMNTGFNNNMMHNTSIMNNNQPLVPNGYGVTAGGFTYSQGLVQNPFSMQMQQVNPLLGSWTMTPGEIAVPGGECYLPASAQRHDIGTGVNTQARGVISYT